MATGAVTVSKLPRGRAVLPVATSIEAVEAVKLGLPVDTIDRAASLVGLDTSELVRVLGISGRTMARRRSGGGSLSADESDRVMRVIRLMDRTQAVIGGEDQARRWLHTPNRALVGQAPLALSSTETGAALVFDLLGRIEHGVFS